MSTFGSGLSVFQPSRAVPSLVADNACAALQQAHDWIMARELQHSDVSRELVAFLARARADLAAVSRLGNRASPDFQDHSRMNITIPQRIELTWRAACELEALLAAVREREDDAVSLALLNRAEGVVHALVDIGQPDIDGEHDPKDIAKRILNADVVFEVAEGSAS